MNQQTTLYTILFWSARVIGSVILGFLLFMIFGHLFTDGQDGFDFNNYYEIFLFACFPILTIYGLLKAYTNPKRGGIIILISMIAFFFLQKGDLDWNIYLLSPILPGILYIVLGILPKSTSVS